MKCNICKAEAGKTFQAKVLQQFDVQYYTCSSCGFLQTEKPYWLTQAYTNAITSLDIGLLYRNNIFRPIVVAILKTFFDPNARFVDYGGGYGVLVRTLRDAGFNYYRYDKFCENIFAKGFDVTDLGPAAGKFELLTAFEVFEHLENPVEEVEHMLSFSDSILFSTELVPANVGSINPDTWWYIAPETGQHISFYSRKSLELLADRFSLNFYTNGSTLHVFSRKKLNPLLFRLLCIHKVASLMENLLPGKSLLESDFNFIKQKLNLNKHS